ncbi:unnamed protein product, partial [marine sediment metagenome]
TGSTFLIDLLKKIDNSYFKDEILLKFLRDRSKKNKNYYINYIRNELDHHSPIVGAKIMLDHLDSIGLKPLDILENIPNAKYIILYRENFILQHISRRIGKTCKKWHIKGNEKIVCNSKIRFNREEFFVFYEDIIYLLYLLVQLSILPPFITIIIFNKFPFCKN